MPSRDPFRIFLSGSTADFGQTRLSLREALSRGGCHVIHQANFPQTQADTVLKLAQLIEPCGILIHLVGRNPGSVATKTAVDEYLAIADKNDAFLKSYPELRTALGDFSGITYPQWEVLIALHLGVAIFVYGDASHTESTHPQRTHLDRLLKVPRHAETFSDTFDLNNKILADLLYHYRQTLPAELVPTFGSVRHNLPTIQRFFGRDAELTKLLPDLHPDATGWGALIDGPGGMGKTTLAIRAAELAAPGHYDDIVFLSAKQTAMDPHGPHDESPFAISGFTQMLDAIARRLQKPEITQAPADERPRLLIDALTGTRTLLVLDNLETLTDADQRSLFAFLGHFPRTCKALLTSRPLVITTGRRLKLQQLDQTAALQTLADIARDNPALDAAHESDRLRLITETGGNTLLLTWTAWQVGSGYCTTIADALAHLRSCPPGNDPLQFIFGDLLARFTPEEERIVATLSYPTEPIPVTAIAEISGVDEPTTRRALKLLTNRSIVVPQEGEEKHALVPMVAEFIRHARGELVLKAGIQMASRACRLINENGWEKHDRFHILEAHWPSISPCLPLFIMFDNKAQQDLCFALQNFLNFQGHWDERLALSLMAEFRAIVSNDFRSAGWRAYEIGWIYRLRKQPEGVLACAERAATHWSKASVGAREHSTAIRLRGKGLQLKQDYPAAVTAFREAHELRQTQRLGKTDLAQGLNDLGDAEQQAGNADLAESHFREALRLSKEAGHSESAAASLNNLAALAIEREDFQDAENLAREALELAEVVQRLEMIGHTNVNLANLLGRQGRFKEALPFAKIALEVLKRLGSSNVSEAQSVFDECVAGIGAHKDA